MVAFIKEVKFEVNSYAICTDCGTVHLAVFLMSISTFQNRDYILYSVHKSFSKYNLLL